MTSHLMRTSVALALASQALCSPHASAVVAPTQRVLGGVILTTPGEVTATCAGVDSGANVDARVADFWPRFDRIFYTQSSGEIADLGKAFYSILPDAIDHVKAPQNAALAAKWRSSVSGIQFRITALASHQLTLMRCFFPQPGSPSLLDEGAMEKAFRSLALGLNARPDQPLQGRMNSIHGWFQWAVFAEAFLSVDPAYVSDEDRRAWEAIRRHVLHGLLLNVYHDTLCPGALCRTKPDLKPPGLAATDQKSLRDYAYDPATPAGALLMDFYRIVLAEPARFPMHVLPAPLK